MAIKWHCILASCCYMHALSIVQGGLNKHNQHLLHSHTSPVKRQMLEAEKHDGNGEA
jgi:hypothetical protein